MPRAKGGPKTRRRRKGVLKAAKGYYGGRSRLIRTAIEAVKRAQRYSTIHLKAKKRDFRALWQTRIGAATTQRGLSYSALMGSLKKAQIAINRKMLSELAIRHPEAFDKIIEVARGR